MEKKERAKKYMGIELIMTRLLHQLGAHRTYNGYNYIVYGMGLIDSDAAYLRYITKSLYIDIASKYATSPMCVEKNIRTVVNKIWEDLSYNEELIREIFGTHSLRHKPTNKEFLEKLYNYAKSHALEKEAGRLCPYSDVTCEVYGQFLNKMKEIII